MTSAKEDAEARLSEIMCSGAHRPREVAALSYLRESIRAAATYCERVCNESGAAASLRAPVLAPAVLARSRGAAVDDVVSNRAHELRRMNEVVRSARGRLLVYFPDAELFDGAAQAATDGLFDLHSAPPWGMWVGYFEEETDSDSAYVRYLLAWIPERLIECAAAGIEVDCTTSILWVDDARLSIRSILKHVDYGAA